MSSKPHHEARAKELHKTVCRIDNSKSRPDQQLEMHYKTWIFRNIPMTHGYWDKRIIDLGCDNGATFCSVKRQNIISVDFVKQDVPNFILADLEKRLPFSDNEFDAVVMTEVLEHIEDPVFSLSEAIRISRDKILISAPYEFSWSPSMAPFTHGEHIRYFTYDSFRKLVEHTGLRNDGVVETYLTNDAEGEKYDYMSWLCTVLYKE